MRNFACHVLLSLCAAGTAHAGGSAVERQEFKQSETYPYVFRPICYLATSGPVPLRFSVSPPDCGDRRAPKLTAAAKSNPKPEPIAPPIAPTPPPTVPASAGGTPAVTVTSETGPAPAFPPPQNAPAPKSPTVDFSQFPIELVEAFKKGREGAETRNYLFDPIFQPALAEELPKSKATYRQK